MLDVLKDIMNVRKKTAKCCLYLTGYKCLKFVFILPKGKQKRLSTTAVETTVCRTPPLIVLRCFLWNSLHVFSQLQCDVWPERIILQPCECAATDGRSWGTKEEEEEKELLGL